MIHSIAVFCGARTGNNPAYQESAEILGERMAHHHIKLVFGGGNVGLMGTIADSVLQHGGQAIGVMPEFLVNKEIAHTQLSQMHTVQSMHERKALMVNLSDAFIALPGGFGTLDELCEVITWAQLGLHKKPIGLLNTSHYFEKLLSFFNSIAQQGFTSQAHRNLIVDATEPQELLDKLLASN